MFAVVFCNITRSRVSMIGIAADLLMIYLLGGGWHQTVSFSADEVFEVLRTTCGCSLRKKEMVLPDYQCIKADGLLSMFAKFIVLINASRPHCFDIEYFYRVREVLVCTAEQRKLPTKTPLISERRWQPKVSAMILPHDGLLGEQYLLFWAFST